MIGVNLSGAEFGAVPGRYGYDYIYPSQSDLSYYANAGVQIVRLPVRWERLQPTVGGALDTAELGRLSTFLDNAANTGIKVIIDLHNFGADFGNKLGTSGASNADFADFWQKLSTAIGNKTAVAGYDLMNEPNNLGDATEWPAAAQAAIDAIRAVDNTHSIYVEGDNWASALNWSANNANLNLSDPANKLIYEAHLYFDKYSTGTYQGTYDSEGATANMAAAELQDFSNWLTAHNAKGFIGEFAVPDNDPRWLTVLDNMLTAMHADGLDGTYWGAGPWWGNYPLALRAADGSANPQLAVLERHIQLEANSSTDGASLAVAHIAMPSDFNGDGNSDILWRNDNGGLAVWDVHTSIPNENAYINSVSTSWHIAETFDMNGDGHSDILWRNDSGALSVWTGGASGFQQAAYNASVGADWHIAGTGDINGDGLSDIIFQRNDGAVAGWTSTGPSFNQSA